MNRRKFIRMIAGVPIAFASAPLYANVVSSADLTGRVLDAETNNLIEKANVWLLETGQVVETDPAYRTRGLFAVDLDDIEPGAEKYRIKIGPVGRHIRDLGHIHDVETVRGDILLGRGTNLPAAVQDVQEEPAAGCQRAMNVPDDLDVVLERIVIGAEEAHGPLA